MSAVRNLLSRFVLMALVAIAPALAAPGDIDPTLNVGLGTSGTVRAVAVDIQNRLLVVGNFTAFNGTTAGRVLRLLENGSVDPSFNAGTGANGEIKTIEILPDQRILVGGQFTSFNAAAGTYGLALLDQNGAVDPGFTSGFAADGFSVGVTCLESIPGGKIMVGGYFTKYASQTAGRYAMITTAGALSGPSPRPAGADSHVFDIDLLANGKMLICGFFDTVDGHESACVARLLSTGAVDTSFGTGTNLGSVAYSVEGQDDGAVIIGGSFSNYFGLGQRYLGRLTSTGLPDGSYLGNTGPNLNVYGLTLDGQGRLIIAGQFSQFQGAAMTGIGRLASDGTRDPSFTFDRSAGPTFIQEFPIDAQGRVIAYGWSNFFGRPTDVNLLRLAGGSWAPQESWRFQHFGTDSATGNAAWNATPAGDGITNLEKYALGFQGDPRTATKLWGDDGLLHGFWKDATSAGFRFRTDLTRTDATTAAEWSDLLNDWTSAGLQVVEESRDGTLVTWRVTLPGDHPSVFFRMKLTPGD